MKKVLLILSSLFILNHVDAQISIGLFNGTTTTNFAPNSVTQLTVGAFKNRKIDIDLKNTSVNTNTYTVTRYDALLNAEAQAYYCFAGSCYGTVTIVSPPLVLRGGKRASDTTLVDPNADYFMLTADLDEGSVMGKSLIKYSFKNVALAADSVQISLSYNGSLGFIKIEKELNGISVFPNPANDKIEVKLTSNKSMTSKAVIINALGSIVKEKDINLVEGKNSILFDIEELPSGIYFARIGTGDNSCTYKFVIN